MIRPSYGYRSAHLVSLSLENPWAGAVVFWADVFAVVSPSTPHQINCRREKEKVPQNTKNKKKTKLDFFQSSHLMEKVEIELV